MAVLDKAALLSSNSLKFDKVKIKELGGEVRLRELSTSARLKIAEFEEKKDRSGLISFALANSIVSEEDKPELKIEEARAFMDANGSVTDAIFAAIVELNGMSSDAIDEAEKN